MEPIQKTQSFISVEEFSDAMPEGFKGRISQDALDIINAATGDDMEMEAFKDSLLSYTNVMQQGKFKIADYVNACRYVSFQLLGHSNVEAWRRTFPERFQQCIDNKATPKTLSTYASAYNKRQIVALVAGQSMVSTYVINRNIHQRSIDKLADLMDNAENERVQREAASDLANLLMPPEAAKIEVDVNHTVNQNSISELRDLFQSRASMLQEKIVEGTCTVQDVAHETLVEKANYEGE